METEVKLAFKDKECLFSAVSTDWFKSRCQNPDNRAVTLENCYMDTSDGILASRGVRFRKRHYKAADTDFYDFKQNSEGDGLSLLDEILKGIKSDDLVVMCSNTFDRTYYDFRYEGSIMEACVDYGAIKDPEGKTCDIICELELELKDGTAKDLESAKAAIVAEFGGIPFNETKLARTLKACRSGGAS